MALYIASDRPLPLRPWQAQPFHTAELKPDQEAVRSHFSNPHVVYAGSYEGCGCGFNYGREHPETDDDPENLAAAKESVAELVRYVQESGVREIYCCWFDDESEPAAHKRTVTPAILGAQDFFFRFREGGELLTVDRDG
jgi:hypothetical protein